MKKASIVIAQVVLGMLIGTAAAGCISEGLVILVLPYLYLWLTAFAVLYDLYQEHLRATLRFDAAVPISVTVAGGPVFFGMMGCI